MAKRFDTPFLILMIAVFFAVASNSYAFVDSNGINVNLGVDGCNSNGICEAGETLLSCPVDCTVIPPPPPPPPGGGNSSNNGAGMLAGEIFINNLSIEPDFTSATIYWSSSIGTRSTVRWGETSETKEGTLRSVVFAMSHKVEIINLKPGTMYFFTIESEAGNGKNNIYGPVYFFTKFLKDTTYPLSPRNVKAIAGIPGISISWQNPPDNNFSYIRIMRHEDRFRGDTFLGTLIYEGTDEKFLDKNVVSGKKYYYVLFSRDSAGDFSVGTGISAYAYSLKNIPTQIPIPTPTPIPILTPLTTTEVSSVISVPETFFVYQYNQVVEKLSNQKMIAIDSGKSTIVDTSLKTFPDDLAQVTNQDGKIVGEYLFSYNQDSNRYQSVVPPLEKGGVYSLKVYRYIDNIKTLISEGLLNNQENVAQKVVKSYNGSYFNYFNVFIVLFILKYRQNMHKNKARIKKAT